jgi:hypothetical protein
MIKCMAFFVLFLTGIAGCEMRKNAKPPKQEQLVYETANPINDKKLMYALMDSALSTGNERVYSKVAGYYIIGSQEQEFFHCAFTMANKYNSALAYYHVFLIISNSISGYPDPTFKKIDKKSKDFALYHLLKSFELDSEHTRSSVEEIFGKNAPIPKSSTYLQKYCTD